MLPFQKQRLRASYNVFMLLKHEVELLTITELRQFLPTSIWPGTRAPPFKKKEKCFLIHQTTMELRVKSIF